MDPVEFRRINDTMKSPIDGQAVFEPLADEVLRSGRAKRSAGSGAGRPGSMRDGEWLVGWGCATAVYPTHIGAATARVRLMAER